MSMRAAALRAKQKKKLQVKGETIHQSEMDKLRTQYLLFQENLRNFAAEHKEEISSSPQLRTQFFELCRRIGVDPLCSNKQILGEAFGVKTFFYELIVQIIELCVKSRKANGGIIELEVLCTQLNEMRKKSMSEVTVGDIDKAIKASSCLGNGLKIVEIHKKLFVTSVPFEFGDDQAIVLSYAESKHFVTRFELEQHGWSAERIRAATAALLNEGILWVDVQYKTASGFTHAYFISPYTSF